MHYEIVAESLNYDNNNSISFLKWNFINTSKLNQFKNSIKLNKIYSVPLDGNTNSRLSIEELSGIILENKLEEFVKKLIPYSFVLHAKIKFLSPYFSSDDDNFYLIQNPCLKEKVFKVPMIRGSGWKGAIASGFRELINETLYKINYNNKNDMKINDDIKNLISLFKSYLRIFGTGSDEFRKLEETIKGYIEKGKNLSKDAIIKFLLFELGLRLTKDDILKINNEREREDFLKEKLWGELAKSSKKEIPIYLQTHKGRTIFYPTYFNKLSLEIINPHSRKTRAGTNPIHYEVVPEGSEGTLQIVYIPFDGVIRKNGEIKDETEKDLENLIKAIEKTKEKGIGAKEKLGWGRFDLINKKAISNNEKVSIPGEWK